MKLPTTPESMDIFTLRINIEKFLLTNAELVKKHCFLQKDKFWQQSSLKQIATEWDNIEKKKPKTILWYFILCSKTCCLSEKQNSHTFDFLIQGKKKRMKTFSLLIPQRI
jgi:hypothetical protein